MSKRNFTLKINIGDAAASARSVDANGYLIIRGCPLSRAGVFDYGLHQCDPSLANTEENRVVKVYRPESEVNNADYMASFERAPIIDDHDFLSGADGDDGMAPEHKGVGGVLTNVHFDAESGWMRGDVTIYSKTMTKDIEDGKTELSLGFEGHMIPETGTYEGQEFEYVQRNMRGNHLALVQDARIKGARILDDAGNDPHDVISQQHEDSAMKKRKVKSLDASAIEKLKSVIPALQEFLQQESEEANHQEGGEADAEENEGSEVAEGSEGGQAAEGSEEGQAAEGSEGGQAAEGSEEGTKDSDELCGLIKQLLGKLGEGAGQDEAGEEEQQQDEEQEGAEAVKSGDAALRSFYADAAAKTQLYDQASVHIGAFDHTAMTHSDMVKYVADKLEIAPTAESLSSFFTAMKRSAAKVVATQVGDSAQCDAITKYLNGQ